MLNWSRSQVSLCFPDLFLKVDQEGSITEDLTVLSDAELLYRISFNSTAKFLFYP